MARILLVDTQSEAANTSLDTDGVHNGTIGACLSHAGHIIQTATDAESALHVLKAWKPHLVALADPSLSALIAKIRTQSADEYAAVLQLAADRGETDFPRFDDALAAGADDFLALPCPSHEVISRVRAVLRVKEAQDTIGKLRERIEDLSTTDEITGLMNIKSLYRRGEEELARARRFQKPLSGLLLNLDAFSAVNRGQGFDLGNRVLREAADRIRSCLRSVDLAARLGADEFFVLLPETDFAGAEFVAERIRAALGAGPLAGTVSLTACVGIGGLRKVTEGQVIGDLLRSTSEALKSAKEVGPDRIEIDSFVIKT
jgi:two-component system cell cycle response regulator